ncbi:MAG: TrlF family AAA-like ATPase, partial [Syntrophobacteraceae bacterium]
ANPIGAPDIFLSGLTVESMTHCGRVEGSPLTLRFHPHFNAIIGGRGTGKSTALEAIRIALRRDQELAAEAPRVKEKLDRFMKSSRDKGVMLDSTEILAEVHRRSGDFRLRWRFDGAGAVLEEKHGNDWLANDAGDVKSRFPVSIYSQKQINELASNPRGLLAIVDRSREVDRAEWAARWEMLKSRFLQMKERQRELLRQLSVEPDIRAKLRDVEGDLRLYEEKGSGDILKQYQKRSQQKNGLSMDSVFDDLAAGMRKLAEDAEFPDFPSYLFDEADEATAEMQSIHEGAAKNLQQMALTLKALADGVEKWKGERHAQIEASQWGRSLQASVDAYTSLLKEYEEKKSPLSLSAYGEWVQQRGQLRRQLEGLGALRKEIESLDGQIEEAKGNFVALRRELLGKRQSFLDKVIGNSPLVRMELAQFGDVSTLEEEYRNLLNLDADKFGSSILDGDGGRGVLYDLRNWEANKVSESELPRLISEMKSKTLDIAMGKGVGNHGKFDNRLRKLFENQPGAFDQLESWWPEDLLRVKYSRDPSSRKFDDLENGSAGQKAAAILAFLLSHGTEPLVMDQPEDDLDNALIYDLIVKQVHENKNRRQLIVVTHNPNIVVNGDAELVHALKFERGQVQLQNQGGLEEPEVREAVCTIMEGGREALTKRYRRMTFEV